MTESCRDKRNKKKSMHYSFRVCQNCKDRDHFRSAMDRRICLMGHMAVDLMVGTGQIGMTRLEMVGSWIL